MITEKNIENAKEPADKLSKAEVKPQLQNAGANKGSRGGVTRNPIMRALLAGLSLSGISNLCLLIVLYVNDVTHERIEYNQNEAKISAYARALMPANLLEGADLKCHLLDNKSMGRNMRLYTLEHPLEGVRGYIMTYSTNRGYASPLVMIASLDKDKKIIKSDILISNETPGIGDKVERANGSFMDMFNGKAYDGVRWDVKKFDGDFDYISGSTVTSRAVVTATGDALKYINHIDIDLLKSCKK